MPNSNIANVNIAMVTGRRTAICMTDMRNPLRRWVIANDAYHGRLIIEMRLACYYDGAMLDNSVAHFYPAALADAGADRLTLRAIVTDDIHILFAVKLQNGVSRYTQRI